MRLNNLSAKSAKNNLSRTNNKMKKDLERLSSGYKINRAGDDASGLAISENMRAMITGLKRGEQNSQEGISLIQTAEGALQEIHSILQRGVELCTQAANGIYTDEQRGEIQNEVDQLLDELDRIAKSTKFNGIDVLRGQETTEAGVAIIGRMPSFINAGTATTAGFMNTTWDTLEKYNNPDGTSTNYTITHSAAVLDFSSFTGSSAQIADAIENGFWMTCCTCSNHYSIQFTNGTSNSLDRSGNHFVYKVGIDGAANASDLIDRIMAATGSYPQNHYTRLQKDGDKLVVFDDRSMNGAPTTLTPGGSWDSSWVNQSWNVKASKFYGTFGEGIALDPSATKEIGDVVLQLGPGKNSTMQIRLANATLGKMGLTKGTVLVDTPSTAAESEQKFNRAIDYIGGERGRMGAYQNRLEHAINNLNTLSENLQASESRIRDADMAAEMMQFTKNNILMQSGQSMLAQANQQLQGILALLQ